MMPLAVPENFGATSIGTDQIGPIVTSRQKKAPLRQSDQHEVREHQYGQQEQQRADEACHDQVAARHQKTSGAAE
jgi:hypothetical protein